MKRNVFSQNVFRGVGLYPVSPQSRSFGALTSTTTVSPLTLTTTTQTKSYTQADVDLLNSKITSLTNELNSQIGVYNSLLSQNQLTIQDKNAALAQIEELKAQIQRLQTKLRDIFLQNEELTAALQQTRTDLTKEMDSYKAQAALDIQKLNTEVARLSTIVSQYERARGADAETIRALTSNLERITTEYTTLKNTYAVENRDLTNRIIALSSRIAELESIKLSQDQRLAEYGNQVAYLLQQIESLKVDSSASLNQLDSLGDMINKNNKLETELTNLQALFDALTSRHALTAAENERVSSEIVALTDKINTSIMTENALRSEFSEKVATLEAEVARCALELSERGYTNEVLLDPLQIEALKSESATLRAELDAALAACKDKDSQILSLTQRVDMANDELEELTKNKKVFEATGKDTALSGGSSLVWWIVGAGVVASAAYWYNMQKNAPKSFL